MYRIIFFAILVFITRLAAPAQDLSLYERHSFISQGDTLPYRLLMPANYDPKQKYALILFLHGAGERGNDNEAQLVHGARLFIREDVRRDYPAIVVFPQCHANSFWSNVEFKVDSSGKRHFSFPAGGPPTVSMRLAQELLYKLINELPVKKKKIYVAGLSMGGMGTFEIVRRNPKLFAAAIPICGGGNPSTADKLKKASWWVFHGGMDAVVPPSWSETMVNALRAVKAKVKYTLYPEANHNSWDPAFAEPDLLRWLFDQ